MPTPAPSGAVTGVVWFDRNEDGDRDQGEWPLPGVVVQLSSADAATPSSASVMAYPVARARPAAVLATTRQTVTGPNGGYRFDRTAPGRYTVTASVTEPGFDYTSDSDGLADWTVEVVMVGSVAAAADFAGSGRGTIEGTVFGSTTLAPVSGAEVTCRWGGLDDVLGTADDVMMPIVANVSGEFELTDVPYGVYSCSGRDPVDGATSAAAEVTVNSPAPSRVPLPVDQRSVSMPITQPATPVLPLTGPNLIRMVAFAAGLLLAGAVALCLTQSRLDAIARRWRRYRIGRAGSSPPC